MGFDPVNFIVATNNTHKVNEIRKILPEGFTFQSLKDIGLTEELPETSGTIRGNALQKAKFVYEKTGLNCLADDSGLVVEALEGAPGVDSAHYAGPDRNDKANIERVLLGLKGNTNRKAYFITIIALIMDGEEFLFEGTVMGNISNLPLGSNGFGYDPIFIPQGENRSFAEMLPDEKNAISHRRKAMEKAINFLRYRF